MIRGKVVSTKMDKTVVVEKEHLKNLPKFERYERRTRRYMVHSPPCFKLSPGNEVTIMECRPLSKTVSFVVVEKR